MKSYSKIYMSLMTFLRLKPEFIFKSSILENGHTAGYVLKNRYDNEFYNFVRIPYIGVGKGVAVDINLKVIEDGINNQCNLILFVEEIKEAYVTRYFDLPIIQRNGTKVLDYNGKSTMIRIPQSELKTYFKPMLGVDKSLSDMEIKIREKIEILKKEGLISKNVRYQSSQFEFPILTENGVLYPDGKIEGTNIVFETRARFTKEYKEKRTKQYDKAGYKVFFFTYDEFFKKSICDKLNIISKNAGLYKYKRSDENGKI
jgi:hypothetical protein